LVLYKRLAKIVVLFIKTKRS